MDQTCSLQLLHVGVSVSVFFQTLAITIQCFNTQSRQVVFSSLFDDDYVNCTIQIQYAVVCNRAWYCRCCTVCLLTLVENINQFKM